MTSKPFYLSLTIVGALVHLFITLAALFGVDLGDQSGVLTKNIEQFTLAAAGLLATASTIVGRIRARETITLGRTPPSASAMLLLSLAAGAGCVLITACVSTTGGATAGATGATPSPALTNVGWTVANYLQTLNNGTTIPQVDQVLAATHNTGDIPTVNLVTALVGQVASAVAAAHNAGATTMQTQAAVSTVLAPSAVAQTAANVTATTPAPGS